MFYGALGLAALLLLAGLLLLVIVADTTRWMVRFDLAGWRERQYIRMLPNFLQALYDRGLTSPWPRRMDAVSATLFQVRIRRILRERPMLVRRGFLRQHYTIWVVMASLRPFLDDSILAEQQRMAMEGVHRMADSADRDRLMHFVAAARTARAAFARSLAPADRQLLLDLRERDLLGTLKRAHAIFREHGYCLWPALEALNHWHGLPGEELVQELPAIDLPGGRKPRVAAGPARRRAAR